MKKIILQLSLLLVIISNCCFSQNNKIEINYSRPPLNQLRANNIWDFTLINTSTEDLEFFLYGTLTEKKAGPIANGTTVSIKLKKGEVKKFKISDLPQTPEINYVHSDPRYKEALIRAGNLPDGDYEICVTAKKTVTGEELGNDCMEQVLTAESDVSLNLISPENNSKIKGEEPLVFNWVLIGTQSTGYKIKIVEILGDENPENAMLKNKAFFEKEEMKLNSLRLPSSVKIEPNKKYAWQITSGKTISEIRVFSLRDEPSTIICSDFESLPLNTANVSSIGNWRVYNSGNTLHPSRVQVRNDGTNGHIMTGEDFSGSTFLINAGDYQGDWSGYCSFCFDIRLISDGGSYSPPLEVSNSVYIFKGLNVNQKLNWPGISGGYNSSMPNNPAIGFGFALNTTRNETSGWRNVCLPLREISTSDPLPSNTWGTWVSTGNTFGSYATVQEAWNDILHDVDVIAFAIDCTNLNQSEVIGVDNICLEEECIETNSDPCNSYGATVAPAPTGDCCWSINLTHPADDSQIRAIEFHALAPIVSNPPTVVFTSGSSITPTGGWAANPTLTMHRIQRVGNSPIPNSFNYYLSYSTSPQRVVVNWLGANNTLVCSDTVTTNCDIPCAVFSDTNVTCTGTSTVVTFDLHNNTNTNGHSGFAFSEIEVTGITPSTVIAVNTYIQLSPSIPPGGNSTTPISLTLNGANSGDNVCIIMRYKSPDGCCLCTDTLCVTIPQCICNNIDASITGDAKSCCYNLTLQNNYLPGFFDKIVVRTLNGVNFSTFTTAMPDWGTLNPFPSNSIELLYFNGNGTIPTGNFANIFNFCLTDYNSQPQTVVVEWMNNNNVICRDTLITPCAPPPPPKYCCQILNDTLICREDGTYEYKFDIRNNYSFIATGFQMNPLYPSGATFTPNRILTTINPSPGPGSVSGPHSIIISNVGSATNFCYKLAMFQHTLNSSGEVIIGNCCYGDSICVDLPQCPETECFDASIKNVKCDLFSNAYTFDLNILHPSKNGIILSTALDWTITLPNTVHAGVPVTFSCKYTGSLPIGSQVCIPVVFVESPSMDTCIVNSCFIIPDCKEDPKPCDCGKWENKKIKIKTEQVIENVSCGKTFDKVIKGQSMDISFPDYICYPKSCKTTYKWEITGPQSQTGTTNVISNVSFTAPGTFNVKMYAYCGDKLCDSCSFEVIIKDNGEPCECSEKGWKQEKNNIEISGDVKKTLSCGDELVIYENDNIIINAPEYECKPSKCKATYTWTIADNSGRIVSSGTGSIINHTFGSGTYWVTMRPSCNGIECDKCVIQINVKEKPKCDCGTYREKSMVFTRNEQQWKVNCGKEGTFEPGTYNIVSPLFECSPSSCKAEYNWSVEGPISGSGTGQNFDFNFTIAGKYKITFTPVCGGNKCKPCIVEVEITGSSECKCAEGIWRGDMSLNNTRLYCNVSPNIIFTTGFKTLTGAVYQCSSSSCTATYIWEIRRHGGTVATLSGQTVSYNFAAGTYDVIYKAFCNGIECGKCLTTLRFQRIIWNPNGDIFRNIVVKNSLVSPGIFNPNESLRPDFKWETIENPEIEKYFRLVKVSDGSDVNNLLDAAKELADKEPLFEAGVKSNSLIYPSEASDLEKGSYYIWIVYELDEKQTAKILTAGFFKAGINTPAKLIDDCYNCSKYCSEGKCWKIGDSCYCY